MTPLPPARARRGPRARLRERLRSQGTLRRGVALLAGGHAVAQLIVAVTSPVISRLYDPAEFGAYAAAVALLLVLLPVTCAMYDHAVPLPEDFEGTADLVILAVLGTLGFSALTALALALAGEQIFAAVDAEALAPYAWLLIPAQLGGGLFLAFTGLATRRRDYGGMARSRVTQNTLMVGTQIAAGATGAGAAGLLIGDALGRVGAGARLAQRGLRGLRESFATTTVRRLRETAARYRRFPLIATWPMVINAVALQVPVLLVVALYGPHVGGLFAFGQRLIGAPVGLLVLSIADVYFGEAARLLREDPAELEPLYRRTLRKLTRGAVPLTVLAVPASFLVGPLFGEQWAEAGTYIAILTPMYVMQVVSSPFGSMLNVLERQDLFLLREIVRIVLISGAVVVAAALSLPPVWAVAVLSAAGCVSYVAYGALSWYALDRYERARRAAA